MMTGTVKWFNNTKGFGFIVPDDAGDLPNGDQRDIFAHYSEIDMKGYRALKAGQLVTFDLRNGDKGEQAINIKPISSVELPNYEDTKQDLAVDIDENNSEGTIDNMSETGSNPSMVSLTTSHA